MSLKRAAPLSGIAFIVLFIASVVVSSVPKDTAGDKAWLAAYSTHAKQAGHLATGVLLVLAALCLMAFLTHLWAEVVSASEPQAVSPLPIVAAGVAAAGIAAGGVLMAAASGSALLYSQPLPGADVLRLCNDLGFAMVAIAGMLAAALSVATVSRQARRAGVISARLSGFGLAVAIALLASVAFVPIVALMIWLLVVTVSLTGTDAAPRPAPDLADPTRGEAPTLPAHV